MTRRSAACICTGTGTDPEPVVRRSALPRAAPRATAGQDWARHVAIQRIGRAAIAALHDELTLFPKPGLVSCIDSGSHSDMDARTFMRSLFALRHYFLQAAALGAAGAGFAQLQAAGIAAEARMLAATSGINTHRGAIFSLGLLCASAGALVAQVAVIEPLALRRVLLLRWGDALRARHARTAGSASPRGNVAVPLSLLPSTDRPPDAAALGQSEGSVAVPLSLLPLADRGPLFPVGLRGPGQPEGLPPLAVGGHHEAAALGRSPGTTAARRYGLRGAGAEAALAFPVLFDTTAPALRAALQQGLAPRAARVQALMHTIAVLDDTNLAHRAGLAGLRWAQAAAQGWLQAAGAARSAGAAHSASAAHSAGAGRSAGAGLSISAAHLAGTAAAAGAARADGLAQAAALHREFVARRVSPGGAADMLAAACWLQRICVEPA